jgi:hypothetical protein
MTSYLQRLKAKIEQTRPPEAPSKPSKAQSGGVTAPFEPFEGSQGKGFCPQNDDSDVAIFEERAAICEHDGGISRPHAETLAALHAAPLPAGISEESRAVVIQAAALFLDRRRKGESARAEV